MTPEDEIRTQAYCWVRGKPLLAVPALFSFMYVIKNKSPQKKSSNKPLYH